MADRVEIETTLGTQDPQSVGYRQRQDFPSCDGDGEVFG